jgi:predicted transcriptional regulator
MLGIRLSPDAETRLARYAREVGRPKSVVARDWIIDRLDREDIDDKIRNAAALDAGERTEIANRAADEATTAWLRWLDAEDGGYDWGPEGPPEPL